MPIPTQVNLLFERTLVLARKAWGRTHPNPMVGALIVEDGEIVAEGFHERAGNAHAEVAAFSALGRKPREGATLFVSLEPCSTHGKTPPCTELCDVGYHTNTGRIQDDHCFCTDCTTCSAGRPRRELLLWVRPG